MSGPTGHAHGPGSARACSPHPHVVTEWRPAGYQVVVSVGDDLDLVLTCAEAVAYADTVYQVTMTAAYEAAVYAQMLRVVDGDEEAAGLILVRLRQARPPVDQKPCYPLEFVPQITVDRRPVVQFLVDGADGCVMTMSQAREHVMTVLGAAYSVDLDTAYHRVLTETIDLDGSRAKAVVGQLGKDLSPFI